jgi:hypothetical protein
MAAAAGILVVAALTTLAWPKSTATPATNTPESAFWQQAIGDGSGTLFVSEDIDFLATVTATRQRPALEAYADGRSSVKHLPVAATTQLSLKIATRLAAHQPERFGRVRFTPSGEVRLDSFKGQNVILVGSPRACPWLSLFEASMDFHFEHDPVRLVSGFRNLRPKHGEAALFAAAPSNSVGGKVYSTVASLPNLSGNGRVLILMGTRSEGTAAAAEAVTTPGILQSILAAAGYSGTGAVPYFEALLESRVIGDSTTPPELVTVRTHSAAAPRLTASRR